MQQLFKLKNEKTWRTLLLTDTDIMVVNKSYDTPEEFMSKFHEKGLLKERLEIGVTDITRMVHPEKESSSVVITYPGKSKGAVLPLQFASATEQQQFVSFVSGARKMTSAPEQAGLWKSVSAPVIGLGFTAFIAFIVYSDAAIIEAGGEVDTSGRKSLYKKLFAWLGETLGTQGTILVAVLIALICIWFIYKRITVRPVEIVYS